MILLGARLYNYVCSGNQVEPFGDQLADAIDVQMPWEDHPRRHHNHTLWVNLWMDVTPVTNAMYADFLEESGWRPATDQNWLKSWDASPDSALPTVPPGDEMRPVNWVSRDDAQAYCTHYDKRLPEAWEVSMLRDPVFCMVLTCKRGAWRDARRTALTRPTVLAHAVAGSGSVG
eukprot:SAG25_NODE_2553_length_1537_cov_1.336579_2_plen_174_part_00